MEEFGYVTRRSDGKYQTGPTLLQLGSLAVDRFDLEESVRPILRALSEKTRETASIYVQRGNQRECLYRHEPDRAIRHIVAEGTRLSLDSGASGHVIANWAGCSQSNAPKGEDCVLALGERDPEVAAIAVPLFDVHGAFFGALAVSGLITRFEAPKDQGRLREALLEAAKALHRIGLVSKE